MPLPQILPSPQPHATTIDRRAVKQDVKAILSSAQVRPKAMVALVLGVTAALTACASALPSISVFDLVFPSNQNPFDSLLLMGTFLTIFIALLTSVLNVGFTLYCMRIHRGESVAYLDVLDSFSFAGSVIGLMLRQFIYTWLWSCLFLFPGIVAAYRYRFAVLNLCQHPDCSPRQAMELSKHQTHGYKMQLVTLDLSYLGWIVLSQLPVSLLNGLATGAIVDPATIALPPYWVQTAFCLLWDLVVCLFYLPSYRTSEVAYFQIAKDTCPIKYVSEDEESGNFSF